LRWIDEIAESQRLFREAAADLIARVEEAGRGDALTRAHTAGFFLLAGEPDAAREWAARAVEAAGQADEHVVETLYVGGDAERAWAFAAERGVRGRAVELLEAERDGDPAKCDAVIARHVGWLSGERVLPFEASSLDPLHTWDWLEVAHRVRARISGEPAPPHEEMLAASGLLDGGAPRAPRTVRVQPGAVEHVPVIATDGASIDAVIDRREPGYVVLQLDPRPGSFLTVTFAWSDGSGHVARLLTEPETSPAHVFDHTGPDFTDVADAAAEWLAGVDLGDRDGAWTGRTLRDLVARLH
jgi:hypothetical protein